MKFKIPFHLKTFNSPFKRLRPKLYIGKFELNKPINNAYIRPYKIVMLSKQEVFDKAKEVHNRSNSIYYKKNLDDIIKRFEKYSKNVRKKFGFYSGKLNWYSKIASFQFAENPIWSLYLYNYHISIVWDAVERNHYWPCYLYYYYYTDKSKSVEERVLQCYKKHPRTGFRSINGVGEEIDYYSLILKDKYKCDIVSVRDRKLNDILKNK